MALGRRRHQDRGVGQQRPATQDHQAGTARPPAPAGRRARNGRDLWTDHDLVFPTSIGTPIEPRNLNRHFEGIRERAGFPTVRLHDFRYTVVSLLLELKTPPRVVQQIARHADLDGTLAIYAHHLDAMREALDSIEWEDLNRRCYAVATPGLVSDLAATCFPWSGWRDLNPRPLAPKASALPSCATPRRYAAPSLARPAVASRRARRSRANAGVAQWQSPSLPSWPCGFDSRRPLHHVYRSTGTGSAHRAGAAQMITVRQAEQSTGRRLALPVGGYAAADLVVTSAARRDPRRLARAPLVPTLARGGWRIGSPEG